MMASVLVLGMPTGPAVAQRLAEGGPVAAKAPAAMAACGANSVSFDVKEQSGRAAGSQLGTAGAGVQVPEGKAMVFVAEDIAPILMTGTTLRIGVDGTWVGLRRRGHMLDLRWSRACIIYA